MCQQSPMYKVSQLGAAKPRGFVKPAASAAGGNAVCSTCGEPGNGNDAVCVSVGPQQAAHAYATARRACSAACLEGCYRTLFPAADATGCK